MSKKSQVPDLDDLERQFLDGLPSHHTLEFYDGCEVPWDPNKNLYTTLRLCRIDIECLIGALTCFERFWLSQTDISALDFYSFIQANRALELHQIFELRKFLTSVKVKDLSLSDDDLPL